MPKRKQNEEVNKKKLQRIQCTHWSDGNERHQFPPSASNITCTHCESSKLWRIAFEKRHTMEMHGSLSLSLSVCIEYETLKFSYRIFRECVFLCVPRALYNVIIEYAHIILAILHCTRPRASFPTNNNSNKTVKMFSNFSVSRSLSPIYFSRNAACVLRYVDKQSAIRLRKTQYDV